MNQSIKPISRNENSKIYFTLHATKPNILVDTRETVEYELEMDGWNISTENPELIVKGFSNLRIKKDYKLRGYQYLAGGNGNGVVWAIPEDKHLPLPHTCETLNDHFLAAPKPKFALEDFMGVIEGDKNPLSYLQASIIFHELHEFGARWHGVSWGQDVILPINDYEEDEEEEIIEIPFVWDMIEEKPLRWEPHFYYSNEGNPVVVFYTMNNIGEETLNRYVHVFHSENYTLKVERTCIGTGGPGIIF